MDLFRLTERCGANTKTKLFVLFIKIIKMNYAEFCLEPLPQSLTQFYEVECLAPTSEHRLHQFPWGLSAIFMCSALLSA